MGTKPHEIDDVGFSWVKRCMIQSPCGLTTAILALHKATRNSLKATHSTQCVCSLTTCTLKFTRLINLGGMHSIIWQFSNEEFVLSEVKIYWVIMRTYSLLSLSCQQTRYISTAKLARLLLSWIPDWRPGLKQQWHFWQCDCDRGECTQDARPLLKPAKWRLDMGWEWDQWMVGTTRVTTHIVLYIRKCQHTSEQNGF